MNKFLIEIASVPDRENLVAEIWYSDILVAEINQEKKRLEIEFFQSKNVVFDLEEFSNVLQMAKEKLK